MSAELSFEVLDAAPERYAAAPILTIRLGVTEATGVVVHSVALRCQIRIEPQRRTYDTAEEALLRDIFGTRPQWSETLRPFLWTHCTTLVQGFSGTTEVALPVACSYDFAVAAHKYLAMLRDGEIPLVLLFSGTVFSRGADGLQVSQVPWHAEANYRLPVAVWRAVMDQHFPNTAWIRLGRESFEALARYKSERGLLGWDEAVDDLLHPAAEGVR
jgi:Family of unknown function (DUF6084)